MGRGPCTQCRCTGFFDPKKGPPDTLAPPLWSTSLKCECGHKFYVHDHPGEIGGIATCFIDNETRFIWIFGQESRTSVERSLLNAGFNNAVVRIIGSSMFLAIAEAEDGYLGWGAGGETRALAERAAKKACSGPHPVVRLSFHTGRGEVVQKFR